MFTYWTLQLCFSILFFPFYSIPFILFYSFHSILSILHVLYSIVLFYSILPNLFYSILYVLYFILSIPFYLFYSICIVFYCFVLFYSCIRDITLHKIKPVYIVMLSFIDKLSFSQIYNSKSLHLSNSAGNLYIMYKWFEKSIHLALIPFYLYWVGVFSFPIHITHSTRYLQLIIFTTNHHFSCLSHKGPSTPWVLSLTEVEGPCHIYRALECQTLCLTFGLTFDFIWQLHALRGRFHGILNIPVPLELSWVWDQNLQPLFLCIFAHSSVLPQTMTLCNQDV